MLDIVDAVAVVIAGCGGSDDDDDKGHVCI